MILVRSVLLLGLFSVIAEGVNVLLLNRNVRVVLRRERATQRDTWLFHVGDGYHFHINSGSRGSIYLKCIRYERGCHGRAIYYRGTREFEHTGGHNHDPDPYLVSELRLRRCILDRCLNLGCVSFQTIVEEERRRFPRVVQSRVTLARMRPAMQRTRRSLFPDVPQTLRGLTELLQDPRYRLLTMTYDGEDNFYASSVDDVEGNHHVILLSRRMIVFSRRLRILFADGTFQTTPAIPGIAQIFCMVANWRHHILPLGWILMESQTQIAYTAVGRVLRFYLRGAPNLSRIITDFERALQNALSFLFPLAILQGCFFHYVQALVKYAKNVLHMGANLRNGRVRLYHRLCCALALLPQHLIGRGFGVILHETMQAGLAVYQIMRPFFRYMLRRWVGNPQRRATMCVYMSPHRTNNTCESNNNELGRRFNRRHANIYDFLGILSFIEDRAVTDIQTLEDGGNPSRRRRASAIVNDLRLRAYSEDLHNPPGPINQSISLFLHRAVYLFENLYNNFLENA